MEDIQEMLLLTLMVLAVAVEVLDKQEIMAVLLPHLQQEELVGMDFKFLLHSLIHLYPFFQIHF